MENLFYGKKLKKFDVNEIKKNLLSRKIENKISAAKRLFRFLMKNRIGESHVILINADVVEMLCEASCTTNIVLLKYVFKCMSVFIECTQFFQQNHTTYTMESIIRALYILLKTQGPDNLLILGLELVSDIISRLNRQHIAVNTVCNLTSIICLLSKLLTCKSSRLNIYAVSEVVISLLHSQGIQTFKKIMEETVFAALKILVEIAAKYFDKKCIIIISLVVNGSMRFLVRPKVEGTSESSENLLFLELISIMKRILVPFLIENENKLGKNDLGVVQIILSALLSIYHYPEDPATKEFSHFLATKGLIDFLPSLEAQGKSVMEFVIIIRSLLFELLRCLSSSTLGKENWRTLLLPGFEALPSGSSFISTILFHQSNNFTPITSIVYCYFYLLSSSNPTIALEYFHTLSRYILSLTCTPSASVTKALWLICAVAYLGKGEESHLSKMGLYRLIHFITDYNIEKVYTHHPAILYWAFSDEYVSNELQSQIIKQWMDDGDVINFEDLKLLLTINMESCFVMMGLMASDNKLSLPIYKILTSIIQSSNGKAGYIYDYAWIILPQYLAQFSSYPDPSKYECLTNVMNFCQVSKPIKSDISQVLRISCLLLGAFLKYFEMSITPKNDPELTVDENRSGILRSTFSLIDNLLKISLKLKDKRVLAIYLSHETFLNTVELLLTSDSDIANASLMKLLTSFVKCQRFIDQKYSKTIHVDVTRLIQFLCRQSELCIQTLKFLAIYLEIMLDNVSISLIYISFQDEIKVRTLYVQIQMLCAKADYEVSTYCWICLKKLLELSDSLGLRKHLSSIPYTPALLSISLDTGTWKEAVSFIRIWFPNLPKPSSRSLATPSYISGLTNFIEKLRKTSKDPQIIDELSEMADYSTNENVKEEKI